MIEKILIRGVTSYSPHTAVPISPLKRISVFYGQNGTGKTTIGNYLQASMESCYNACYMEPAKDDREIFVYNHTFMEKNFHEVSSQPGVFTLNEGNIEAENSIKAAESEIKTLSEQEESEMKLGSSCKVDQETTKEALKDNIWKLKRSFDNTSLTYCFKLLNSKEKVLDTLTATALASTADTPEGLMAEAAELQAASDEEKPGIPRLSFQACDLELNPIFQEIITGTGNSYLSALIQELGNSDWVKHALSFARTDAAPCPFCQQPLPKGFHEELAKVFDKTYEQRLSELGACKRRYDAAVEQFLAKSAMSTYQLKTLEIHVANLRTVFQKNVQAISTKVASPSVAVTLEPTAPLVDALNAAIAAEQQKIDEINLKIKDKKAHLEKIRVRFWTWFRASFDSLLTDFDKVDQQFTQKRQQARDAIKAIRASKEVQRAIITQSKAAITNVDQSVDSINNWLRILGLRGFELIKEDGAVPQYRLQRPEQRDGVFKTLSEGEKTLISFLYFLEVCNGELNATAGRLISDRIIVIDDPISSLSHNYVYDIASLIKRQVLTPKTRFKQVIILTHNLFFFHEMVKLVNDDMDKADKKDSPLALFRITKSEYSAVAAMEAKEIQNDYQAFWQTIKDALNGRTSSTVIPNMMRNILEHYFTFVHRQDKLFKALEDLSDENPQFRALYRYMNRESHADAVNITDFGDIDPTVFVERFREVFVKTEFEEHYDKMMA